MSHQLFEEQEHTNKYRQHRPGYPKQLYEHILNYYFKGNRTDERIPLALDVGCGSGQATIQLSPFCDRVIAIDASANQIAHAIPKENIEYRCQKAEDLSFLPTDSVDLITIATALHWLDIEPFFEQVQRVLKPHTGVFAVWTYSAGSLDNPVADAAYHEFDQVILFSYWSKKRWLTDEYYQSLLPLFPYKPTLAEYTIEQRTETTVGQFLDLVQTFSGLQTYCKQEGEEATRNILDGLRDKLIDCYTKTPNQAANDDKRDDDALPMVVSNPIRLYLMRKEQSN